jgi:hypothetical protein
MRAPVPQEQGDDESEQQYARRMSDRIDQNRID